jgi:hypothetical protein
MKFPMEIMEPGAAFQYKFSRPFNKTGRRSTFFADTTIFGVGVGIGIGVEPASVLFPGTELLEFVLQADTDSDPDSRLFRCGDLNCEFMGT